MSPQNLAAVEPALAQQAGWLLPYLLVAGGGLLVMLVDAFRKSASTTPLTFTSDASVG